MFLIFPNHSPQSLSEYRRKSSQLYRNRIAFLTSTPLCRNVTTVHEAKQGTATSAEICAENETSMWTPTAFNQLNTIPSETRE